MVPKWAPGVITTIRQITNKSYRQLGADLGVADSSVIRWENNSIQISEQNWGIVKRYYSSLFSYVDPKWDPEKFILVLPKDGFFRPNAPSFELSQRVTRKDLADCTLQHIYRSLKSICPGFEDLVIISRNSTGNYWDNPLIDINFHWHEFCFYSCDLSQLMSDDLWNLAAFAKMAASIHAGFRGNSSSIASYLDFNADIRGATVDFKIGCLIKD